ncbi:Maf family protein [Methylococcus geothermalis]|uniref:7-methyl-GTP pyrophosphatase n=1 Tax=Methylococcus geothermalis TaxID=2681310 RepID=A0A858Q7G9_9GAMM|nr:nucleoside triphosphate pyrophosphatase [Methylococcus geothermalis]QJD29761.1 septum formation inhibitor Maf [Methylococcus geothermalis]
MQASSPSLQPLVLASGSSYRRELLSKLGLAFTPVSPNIDESALPGEDPADLALRLSCQKAQALAPAYPDHLIIGSDQVAVLGERRLGKPGNHENAVAQLQQASGKIVTFLTGLCVYDARRGISHAGLDRCRVHFRRLDRRLIERYVAIDQPYDCAGAFKSEGLGIALLERIEGDDPNALVGLPLILLTELLRRCGVAVV